jgi:hypothetical protein
VLSQIPPNWDTQEGKPGHLSPIAANLAMQIPYAKPLLKAVNEPSDPNDIPGFKPMSIFV